MRRHFVTIIRYGKRMTIVNKEKPIITQLNFDITCFCVISVLKKFIYKVNFL